MQPPMRTASASLLIFQHLPPSAPSPCVLLWGPKPQASRHVQTSVLTAPPSRLFSEVSPILTQTSSPARLSADALFLQAQHETRFQHSPADPNLPSPPHPQALPPAPSSPLSETWLFVSRDAGTHALPPESPWVPGRSGDSSMGRGCGGELHKPLLDRQ